MSDGAFGHPYDPAVVAHEFAGCHCLNPDGLLVAVDGDRIVADAFRAKGVTRFSLEVAPGNERVIPDDGTPFD